MQASILLIPHQESPYPEEPYRCIPLQGIAIEVPMKRLTLMELIGKEETLSDHIETTGTNFMFMRRSEGFVICLN